MARIRNHVGSAGLMALAVILLFGGTSCTQPEESAQDPSAQQQDPGDRPAKYPSQWFLRQRMTGGQPIPVNARSRAMAELQMTDDANAAPGVWVNVGPLNVGGRVTALAVDPNDPDHIWLGAADGGVWTTTDEGVNWTSRFDDQTALSIGAIALHPTDSNTAYVGTGEDNGGGYSYPGEGVFKTTDGGLSWTNLGLGQVRRIGRIVIDPVDPGRVFVAAGGGVFHRDDDRGIYRSTDGGATWQKVLFVADDSGGIDVAIDPSDPNRIFAAIWQRNSFATDWYIGGPNSGVWRSLDGGDSWTRMTNGLPTGANVGRIGLAIAKSNPQVVYALIINSSARLLGIYRSDDGGDSWIKRNSSSVPFMFGGFSYYFGNIRVDPQNQEIVYALDVNLLRSTNGGFSFSFFTNGMHVDQHDLVIGPGSRMVAGNDGGFYSSTNGGLSWTHAVTLPITQFYDIGIDTLDPNRRFGGTQDNGTNRTTTGGTSDWGNVLGGDGMQCEVDPTDSNKVYAESQFGNIRRSTDGGDSFVSATDGIDPDERANWVTPITVDSNTPSTLYTGFQRVYRSTDSAVSWNPISPDLTNGPPFGQDHSSQDPDWRRNLSHTQNLIRGTITAVNVSPVDDRIVWAGTDDGNVWVTGDSGFSWSKVNPPDLALWVTDIACDPFDAQTAYLSVTGYRAGDRLPYLRQTTDLGATWQDISGGLPQIPINSVIPDPDWKGRLFVGSDVGVHLTDDGGASWSMMSGDLPFVVVLDLAVQNPSRTLYAGTHGRSIYTYDLGQLPPPDRDGDGVVNVDDCAPDDAGAFAPPDEVASLMVDKGVDDSSELSWSSLSGQAGSGTVYDVTKGALDQLAADGSTIGSTELACSLTDTMTTDPAVPATGTGLYYMVRGRNVCGDGSWGQNSQDEERVSSAACP